MNTTRHLIVSILITIIITASGTIGYMLVEDWNLADSIYMTAITLSTIGYGEIHQLHGAGRIFTIFLIVFGVGLSLYVAGALVQFIVEGQIRTILGRRRLDKRINRLKNHYIICGYGRIGKVICDSLRKKPFKVVVIEKDKELIPFMEEDGLLYISGDTVDESNLLKAGIDRAKGVIAALATDADNVFLVLTAKQLNPEIFIMARAGNNDVKSKLTAAGADIVESPYEMGAENMAQKIIRPAVTGFLDLALTHRRKDIQMEEILVSPSSPLANVMLKDSGIRQEYNLIIIAIKKADDKMLFNPSFETKIKAGDTLIAVGEDKNLQQLEKALNP
ncbi:MAG: potassium channel protein [Desulfosarcina sp.]|nr:potassium channel protein [Desulfobacterales bacterium]